MRPGLYEHVFGINPLDEVEKERQKTIQARQRAEEERQRVNGIILYLHQEMHLLAPQIAEIVDKDQAYIEELLAKAATENGEN